MYFQRDMRAVTDMLNARQKNRYWTELFDPRACLRKVDRAIAEPDSLWH